LGHGGIGIEDGLLVAKHDMGGELLATHLRRHHGHHRVRVRIGIGGKSWREGRGVLERHRSGRNGGHLVLVGNCAASVGGGELVHLSVFVRCRQLFLREEDKLPKSVCKNQGVDLKVNKEEGKNHHDDGKENENCVILLIIRGRKGIFTGHEFHTG